MKTYQEIHYGERVDSVPENAVFYGYRMGYIRVGEVYKRALKTKTLYHTHEVGGSNGHGPYGRHLVYCVSKTGKEEQNEQ